MLRTRIKRSTVGPTVAGRRRAAPGGIDDGEDGPSDGGRKIINYYSPVIPADVIVDNIYIYIRIPYT